MALKSARASLLLLLAIPGTASAQGAPIGSDAGACETRSGPAILADIVGLKDRKGDLTLELYPANETDFLKDDRDLLAEGKTFRRVRVATPPSGPVALCIRVPRPGRYALLFTHDRDGKHKFSFWSDGAGFPSNRKLGRSRPKVDQALVDVGPGVVHLTIRAQYLRGFSGFGPIG